VELRLVKRNSSWLVSDVQSRAKRIGTPGGASAGGNQ